MSEILITGGESGLGRALVEVLDGEHKVHSYDIKHGNDVASPNMRFLERIDHLDVLINCAGINIIDWLPDASERDWDWIMDVNAKGIYKMSQACLPKLIDSKGTILNIVSNASHMPMTCSLAYNASKGAAHIMTLQLARELTKAFGITVFGVSPNKLLGTAMSASIDAQVVRTRGWTFEEAHEYQVKGMLAGEETPPELVAEFIAYLLQDKRHHKHLTGCIIPYGA